MPIGPDGPYDLNQNLRPPYPVCVGVREIHIGTGVPLTHTALYRIQLSLVGQTELNRLLE